MNSVILKGRLTKDVVLNTSKDGMSIASFTVAIDRVGKDKGADFVSCKAFGKTADFIGKYFGKGKEILVSGRIQTGSYEKDGRKVYTTDVVVGNAEFCGSSTPNPDAKDVTQASPIEGFEKLSDSDIPF